MNIERVKRLLKENENDRLEFKEAATALPESLFETICAMLNRDGGDILLGVRDDGTVIGVNKANIDTLITNMVNLSNNNQKLDPVFILYPQTYELAGKLLIHIQVPASSQVHKTVNTVFDRSNDGDFKVKAPHQIAAIYNRKRNHYSEGIIYPALHFEDFNQSLFPKIRNLIRSNNSNHPWLVLNDLQLLQKAGLWKRDFETGQEGFTLAAVLLFGKDEVIQQVVPHFKIDALVRIQDKLRYDDREYIQTNLIDAYEQLMAFISKHLPDKFHLIGSQRISLRTIIFREIIANIITHREYTNGFPTTIIIRQDAIETENANNPHGNGPIRPDSFTPFPKNPTIAKFMMQLGWVDELGSGVLNVNKYWEDYSKASKPQFIEGATFKIILPLSDTFFGIKNHGNQDGNQEGNQDEHGTNFKSIKSQVTFLKILEDFLARSGEKDFTQQKLNKVKPYLEFKNPYWQTILEFCITPQSRKDIFEQLGVTNQTKNFNTIISPLIKYNMLFLTIKDRPRSKYQKYLISTSGKKMLQLLKLEEGKDIK